VMTLVLRRGLALASIGMAIGSRRAGVDACSTAVGRRRSD
jgi:hypothetical protein